MSAPSSKGSKTGERASIAAPSATPNHVDSRDNEIDLSAGDLANPLRKLLLIERDDERNIGDRVLPKDRLCARAEARFPARRPTSGCL